MPDLPNSHLPQAGTPAHFRIVHNKYLNGELRADEAYPLLAADFADMRHGHELMQRAVETKQMHPSRTDEATFKEIYELFVGFLEKVTERSELRSSYTDGLSSLSSLRSETTRQKLGIN